MAPYTFRVWQSLKYHPLLRGKYARASWQALTSRCFARASVETFVVNCWVLVLSGNNRGNSPRQHSKNPSA